MVFLGMINNLIKDRKQVLKTLDYAVSVDLDGWTNKVHVEFRTYMSPNRYREHDRYNHGNFE